MATITKRIEVCEVCRDISKADLTRFRIAVGNGRLRTYALCAEDAKELRTLLGCSDLAPRARPLAVRARWSRWIRSKSSRRLHFRHPTLPRNPFSTPVGPRVTVSGE